MSALCGRGREGAGELRLGSRLLAPPGALAASFPRWATYVKEENKGNECLASFLERAPTRRSFVGGVLYDVSPVLVWSICSRLEFRFLSLLFLFDYINTPVWVSCSPSAHVC